MNKRPKDVQESRVLWEQSEESRSGMPHKRLLSRQLRLYQLLPNGITVVATCSGIMGLLFALKDAWHWSVLAIIIAGIMDALDGRMARALGSTSHFGAELDSLSDVIAFGVCPVMILYLWGMQPAGNWGVMAVLLFTVCCLLRLARFNTMIVNEVKDNKVQSVWQSFFQGVPAPMGGGVLLLPIVADLAAIDDLVLAVVGRDQGYVFILPFALILWAMLLSLLMISSFPVFSLKKLRVPRRIAFYAMALGVPFVIATLVSRPWVLLLFLQLSALMSLPFSMWSFARLRRKVLEQAGRETSSAAELANLGVHRRNKTVD